MAYLPKKPQDGSAGTNAYNGLADSLGGAASGAAPGGSVGTGQPGTGSGSTQPQGTGFVNPGTYLQANQGAAQGMANGLASGVESGAAKFGTDLAGYQSSFRDAATKQGPSATPMTFDAYNPAAYNGLRQDAAKVSGQASMLGNVSGIQASLQQQHGAGGAPYTAGENRMDGFLAGAAGANRLSNDAGAYSGLSAALGGAAAGGNVFGQQAAAPAPGPRRPSKSGAPDYAPGAEPVKPPKGIGQSKNPYGWGY